MTLARLSLMASGRGSTETGWPEWGAVSGSPPRLRSATRRQSDRCTPRAPRTPWPGGPVRRGAEIVRSCISPDDAVSLRSLAACAMARPASSAAGRSARSLRFPRRASPPNVGGRRGRGPGTDGECGRGRCHGRADSHQPGDGGAGLAVSSKSGGISKRGPGSGIASIAATSAAGPPSSVVRSNGPTR